MKRSWMLVAAVLAAGVSLCGCTGRSSINAYLLEDAKVGGDPAQSIKPIKSVAIWPLENIAAGSKSKGVETRLSGILADTVKLEGGFERVVILEEDQAKDLMARAGEELGLKKKPKAPLDGALIATKVGQLAGTETILMGRLEDYDEDKVDKLTLSVVSASFNLLDAREKAYPAMDSFTPVKRVWRTHIKRASKEGPFNARESIDDAARTMIRDMVAQMTADLGEGAGVSGKALEKRIADQLDAARKHLKADEFDKATAAYNEVLKVQPENAKAKKGLEETEKRKKEAEEKAKAAALKKQTDELRDKALESEKAGDLDAALAGWKKILELDPKHKQAGSKVTGIEKKIEDQKKKEAEEAEKKAAAEKKAKEEAEKKAAAEKAAAEKKAKDEAAKEEAKPAAKPAVKEEAEPAAKPALKEEAEPAAKPAAKEEAEPAAKPAAKEEAKPEARPAVKEEAEPAAKPAAKEEAKPEARPAVKEEAKPEAKPAAKEEAKPEAKPAPAAAGSVDDLRNQAMAAFNKEDYETSRDLWKKILETLPEDKQAKEMLETTEMLLNALK